MARDVIFRLALGGNAAQQRQFLRFGRPGAVVASLAVFGTVQLLQPGRHLGDVLLILLVAGLPVSGLSLLALRQFATAHVLRVVLTVDIVMIALLTGALEDPNLLVVAYFAPIAFAALLFGPLETAFFTVTGGVAGVVVGRAIGADTVTIASDLLVLGVTGAILAALSGEVRRAQIALARSRAIEVAALDVSERLRHSLQTETTLETAVRAVGEACEATRALLRRVESGSPVYHWEREGVPELGPQELPVPIARVLGSGEPLVIRSRAEAETDPELLEHMVAIGIHALIAEPIYWQGEIVAVLGIHDDTQRPWTGAAEAVIRRVAPQIGAALAQAEAFELRERLIANVSHELRTPLTSTIGFLRTLERDDVELDPGERKRFIRIARQEAQRLSLLVDDLLDLARLDRGELRMQREPVQLSSLIGRAAASIEVPTGRELRTPLTDDVLADVDPHRMLQVLSNLIMNAFHHGGGAVTVTAEHDERSLRVAVSDEGPGVPPSHVEHLFVPFARWSERSDSSGLGLAIAKRIAEAHGGTLVYRAAENGSPHAFVLELPR